MKLAVIGIPVYSRNRVRKHILSPQQMFILKALRDTPGLSVHQMREQIGYAARANIERALQGLIKKGYLHWDLNPITKGLKYYITPESTYLLSSSNG